MAILLLSADLLFASRIGGAAARLGKTLQTVATAESLIERLAADEPRAEPGQTVVLDLTTRGFDPCKWVPLMRQSPHPPSAILAYGPHVQDALLAAATEAGCDEVFTRGQFNARMDEILSHR